MAGRNQITLYRHGKVSFDNWKWSGSRHFRQLVQQYDTQPLSERVNPNNKSIEGAFVVSSTLRRSKESALELFGRIDLSSDLFREAELPNIWPNLPPSPAVVWFAAARCFWRLGYACGCETYSEFCDRAELATQNLIDLSEKQGKVVLVGHAFVNQFIGKNLIKAGFNGPSSPSRTHMSGTVYSRN